jgi:monoamine oxidase
MQATMFQPMGGMQQIAEGFGRAIKSPIHLNAEVREIRMRGAAVDVTWRDTVSGTTQTVQADYVICTVPLPVLAKVDSNFSKPVKQAIATVPYAYSNKVAFESKRFWEEQHIYGGISFVPGETALIWYPSAGMNTQTNAMLLACYNSGKDGEVFAQRPLAEQIAMSRAAVERLHPGKGPELQTPLAVNWNKIPYNLGPWPDWAANGNHGASEGQISTPAFNLLNQPDGRVYFAGAHLSQTPGWQEGAVLSAKRVIAMIGERANAGRLAAAH